MTSLEDYHESAVQLYHKIRVKYGLEAISTCVLNDTREGFIRGRKADPTKLKPPENHFSYPPSEYCKTYGRANIPGCPVFYAGETPEIIAEEIMLENGDWLHLSVFYTPKPVKMEALLLLHDEYNGISEWAGFRDEVREHINGNPANFGRTPLGWERIHNSALQFRVDNYRDTSSISHFWLYEKGIDAIVYPSIRNDSFCNFALSPTFVDKSLKMYRVYTCRWIDGQLEAHYSGHAGDDGIVIWKRFSPLDYDQWHAGFKFLTEGNDSSLQ